MVERSNKIKYISFDLDETLVDTRGFEDEFWHEIIPRTYSKKHKIPLEKAKKLTKKAYKEVGKDRIEYFMPHYWFKRFKIDEDWITLAKKVQFKIKAFPHVKETLRKLSKRYDLVIVTHSIRKSTELKLKRTELKKFFLKIFSVIDDFKIIKRNESIYLLMLKKLKINPNELIHVGNDYKYDYLIPRKIGIRAIVIDRNKKRKGKDIIHDLRKIESIL
jgi:putative hydrolase of the HAD superfamily